MMCLLNGKSQTAMGEQQTEVYYTKKVNQYGDVMTSSMITTTKTRWYLGQ